RTKQLLPWKGRPLLQHAIEQACAAGLAEVLVVLGHDADRIRAALTLPDGVRAVENPEYRSGQASSLRIALAAASPDAEAAVILMGDQPGMPAEAIRAVVEAAASDGPSVLRASWQGRPGHPVLLARDVWEAVASGSADSGAREWIAAHPASVRDIPFPRPAPPEVDTE